VCNNRYHDNYGYSKHNANIHASSSNLFGSEFIGIANNIEQWNNGNLVTSFRQYCNNNIHFYTNRWSVCYYCKYDNYGYSKHNTNVYASSVNLFGSEFIGIANNIEQWNNGSMVTSFRQYCNNNLHFYPNNRSVCNNWIDDNYGYAKHNSNFYASEFNLFGSEFDGIANNFE